MYQFLFVDKKSVETLTLSEVLFLKNVTSKIWDIGHEKVDEIIQLLISKSLAFFREKRDDHQEIEVENISIDTFDHTEIDDLLPVPGQIHGLILAYAEEEAEKGMFGIAEIMTLRMWHMPISQIEGMLGSLVNPDPKMLEDRVIYYKKMEAHCRVGNHLELFNDYRFTNMLVPYEKKCEMCGNAIEIAKVSVCRRCNVVVGDLGEFCMSCYNIK